MAPEDDMNTRSEQPPSPQPRAALSWKNKYIKDTREGGKIGLVPDVIETEAGIRLVAVFPEDKEPRRIALEPTRDGHFMYPSDHKARYRRLSRDDLDWTQSLGREAAKRDQG